MEALACIAIIWLFFGPKNDCAKEAGKLRIEGKEYVVRDGDVIEFRFKVSK
jgi:hypothetical protein